MLYGLDIGAYLSVLSRSIVGEVGMWPWGSYTSKGDKNEN